MPSRKACSLHADNFGGDLIFYNPASSILAAFLTLKHRPEVTLKVWFSCIAENTCPEKKLAHVQPALTERLLSAMRTCVVVT